MSNEARLPAFLARNDDGFGAIVRTADICSLTRFRDRKAQAMNGLMPMYWGISISTDDDQFHWLYSSRGARNSEWKRLCGLLGQPTNVGD